MIVGSVILCWVALGNVGGFSGMHTELESQNTTLVNFLPTDISLGISLYLLAFFLGGLGVAGQPQVVSRVMTLKSDEDRKQAMIWFPDIFKNVEKSGHFPDIIPDIFRILFRANSLSVRCQFVV